MNLRENPHTIGGALQQNTLCNVRNPSRSGHRCLKSSQRSTIPSFTNQAAAQHLTVIVLRLGQRRDFHWSPETSQNAQDERLQSSQNTDELPGRRARVTHNFSPDATEFSLIPPRLVGPHSPRWCSRSLICHQNFLPVSWRCILSNRDNQALQSVALRLKRQ